ncbi:matrixin family metalloprotease [bacterium]|nr:matrixin family metalloprotease [bacterium]
MKKLFLLFVLLVLLLSGKVFADASGWSTPTYINTYIEPHIYTGMMKDAFYEWSLKTKDKIVFHYIDNPQRADIEVYFVDKLTAEDAGKDSAIGVTKRAVAQEYSKIVHAEILIAEKAPSGRKLVDKEIYKVMLHEIGHAIGLGHSTYKYSIMYPNKNAAQQITQDELNKLSKIYGW